ncbi:MAG TPA: LuxR C-terminal-related transcriptional regulator [Gemmatimonadaceae bacterium]
MPTRRAPKSATPAASDVPVGPAAARAAKDALMRCAWGEARALLETSIAAGETADALEDLGLAAWWVDDEALTFNSRERAYALYREAGDALGASRVAIWLVWDCLSFRGDFAVASGWLERARRLLDGHENSSEYGWLLIREGEVALFRGHDPSAARAGAQRAAKLGRELGDRGVEFTALALEGLSRVSAGDVAAGMKCLDEATIAATAGEMKELHAVGLVCCWQIFACERMRDYDRAAQWCARVQEFTRRWNFQPLSAVCRSQYAGVLIWRGEWANAEGELVVATREIERARPAMAAPVLARLGDLRLRQGRLLDAELLFEHSSGQPIARLGRATLALLRGNADDAAKLLDRFLGDLGADEATARAGALELAVQAHSERGDAAAATRALEDLERVAKALGTVPVSASLMNARGVVLGTAGDITGAADCFEKAVALYEQGGAPLETARARLKLAELLLAAGRADAAVRESRAALEVFRSLGAQHDEARASDFARGLSGGARQGQASQLTARQVEILKLVAQGLSNPDIAKRLRLSDHTVKRHVANLLTKLGLSSRSAAVAYAAKEGLL